MVLGQSQVATFTYTLAQALGLVEPVVACSLQVAVGLSMAGL